MRGARRGGRTAASRRRRSGGRQTRNSSSRRCVHAQPSGAHGRVWGAERGPTEKGPTGRESRRRRGGVPAVALGWLDELWVEAEALGEEHAALVREVEQDAREAHTEDGDTHLGARCSERQRGVARGIARGSEG
eukprot:625396-Prymnesium_polylepis.1